MIKNRHILTIDEKRSIINLNRVGNESLRLSRREVVTKARVNTRVFVFAFRYLKFKKNKLLPIFE